MNVAGNGISKFVNSFFLRFNLMECLTYMGYHLASFFLYMYLIVSNLTHNTENPTVAKEVPW